MENVNSEMVDSSPNVNTKAFSNYLNAKSRMTTLKAAWSETAASSAARRDLRYLDIDLEFERSAGRLDPDEMMIPLRIIDNNIRKEQPHYISYVTKPRRQMSFVCLDDATLDTAPLEKDFTTKCRYTGWEIPHFKAIDAFELHGWSTIEVNYDPNMPGHFVLKYYAHDRVLFPRGIEDIQQASFVMLAESFTRWQLDELVLNAEFSAAQVAKLYAANTGDDASDKVTTIYKVLFRENGFVKVAWAEPEKCDAWIREPRDLFVGIRQKVTSISPEGVPVDELKEVPLREYNLVLLQYNVNENEIIDETKGRAFLDRHVQQAVTSLLSSYVTAHRRASGLYGSQESDGLNTASTLAQTDIKLKSGAIYNKKLSFFQLASPAETMLQAIQAIITQNMQESAQVNFAAMNREDSRKTATEIQAAQVESNLLSSTQVTLYSIGLRKIYTLAWNIYRSIVQQNLVKPTCSIDFFTNHKYELRPAGDQDVVEKQEKIARMQQAWSVIQAYPAVANIFLKKLITLMFPEEAPELVAALESGDLKDGVIKGLMEVCKAALIDPATGNIKEEYAKYAPQLIELFNQANMIISSTAANQNQQGQSNAQNTQPQPESLTGKTPAELVNQPEETPAELNGGGNL